MPFGATAILSALGAITTPYNIRVLNADHRGLSFNAFSNRSNTSIDADASCVRSRTMCCFLQAQKLGLVALTANVGDYVSCAPAHPVGAGVVLPSEMRPLPNPGQFG
jgi:hypothetical protein